MSLPKTPRSSKKRNYKKPDTDSEIETATVDDSDPTMASSGNSENQALAVQIQALRDELTRATEQILALSGSQQNQPSVCPIDSQLTSITPHDAPRLHTQRLHIPKFNANHPHLWFTQIETSFRISGITNDTDQFDHVLVHLEDDVMMAVEDLATNPPLTNKFLALKERIMNIFAQTTESKIRRMLRGEESEDKKPSAILAFMKHLSAGQCSPAIMKMLFLEKLPASIRPILAASGAEDPDKLAEIADRVYEVTNAHTISSVASPVPTTNTQTSTDDTMNLAAINQAIVEAIKIGFNKLQASQSRSHNRSQSQLIQNNNDESRLCYYHERFGENARKCRAPCSWMKKNPEN